VQCFPTTVLWCKKTILRSIFRLLFIMESDEDEQINFVPRNQTFGLSVS
jgi:hypothetical protein